MREAHTRSKNRTALPTKRVLWGILMSSKISNGSLFFSSETPLLTIISHRQNISQLGLGGGGGKIQVEKKKGGKKKYIRKENFRIFR